MQKKNDIEELKKAGVLSAKSTKELEKTGGISKKRSSMTRVLKTADGKWVTPTLYYRGGKGTRPSKKQDNLTNQVNSLITKNTVERKTA